MLQIIYVWWLIGLLIAVVCTSKNLTKDIENYGVWGTFLGYIVLGFTAPIYFIRGIIEGIKRIRNNKES